MDGRHRFTSVFLAHFPLPLENRLASKAPRAVSQLTANTCFAASLNCLSSSASMFARWLLETRIQRTPSFPPEKDDRPVAARPSLPLSGDPLLDDFATQVGVDLALAGAIRSFLQDRVP